MDKKTDKRGEGISRRDMMAAAGIIGAGVTAASMAGGGGLLVPQALAFESPEIPKGRVPYEVLYDPHSGLIMAHGPAQDGIIRWSTDPDLPSANVLLEVDLDERDDDIRKSGILFGGEQGRYVVVNNSLQFNPRAEKTQFPDTIKRP